MLLAFPFPFRDIIYKSKRRGGEERERREKERRERHREGEGEREREKEGEGERGKRREFRGRERNGKREKEEKGDGDIGIRVLKFKEIILRIAQHPAQDVDLTVVTLHLQAPS